MIVKDKYHVKCPAYNKEATLYVGYDKQRASKNDIIDSEKYIGTDCDLIHSGKKCPYIECPFVKKWNLKRSPRD